MGIIGTDSNSSEYRTRTRHKPPSTPVPALATLKSYKYSGIPCTYTFATTEPQVSPGPYYRYLTRTCAYPIRHHTYTNTPGRASDHCLAHPGQPDVEASPRALFQPTGGIRFGNGKPFPQRLSRARVVRACTRPSALDFPSDAAWTYNSMEIRPRLIRMRF